MAVVHTYNNCLFPIAKFTDKGGIVSPRSVEGTICDRKPFIIATYILEFLQRGKEKECVVLIMQCSMDSFVILTVHVFACSRMQTWCLQSQNKSKQRKRKLIHQLHFPTFSLVFHNHSLEEVQSCPNSWWHSASLHHCAAFYGGNTNMLSSVSSKQESHCSFANGFLHVTGLPEPTRQNCVQIYGAQEDCIREGVC